MVRTTIHETDVLVIGGGLAALRTAWEASRLGASVLVVVKRRLGRCGSSAVTSGGYAATHDTITPGDSWQQHYHDTLAGGAHINDPSLARVLCEEAGLRVADLLALGVPFSKTNGAYRLSPSGDHSRPRVLVPVHMRGTDLTLPLRAAALQTGIRVLEDTRVLGLLLDDGAVSGAIALQRDPAGLAVIRAKSTVLGTGGAGRLFQITSNPVDVTGDGYALAARIGVPLRDMEMIQFYPWRAIRPFTGSRVPIQPSTFAVGARLYNSRGERFMEGYDPQRKESTTRDVAARGIFDQIRLGRAVEGGVILDLSAVTDDDFISTNQKVIERLEPRRLHFRDVQFVIAPEAHFVMGGMVIDARGRTPLARLYACGEAAGGVHGGNRLNSNAIPDTQVFGARAGVAAAEEALRLAHLPIDTGILQHWLGRLARLNVAETEERGQLEAMRAELQSAMWIALGIVRTAEGLRQGLRFLGTFRERLDALSADSLDAFEDAVELACMCDTAEVMAAAALARTESRGAHFREDFPSRDDAWLQTVVTTRQGPGDVRVELRPLPRQAVELMGASPAERPVKRLKDEFVE